MKKAFSILGAFVVSVAALHAASDWPQWQGPDRTGVSKETGLMQQWPASGPSTVWSATGLGSGYGSMAVAGNRVFVQGTRSGSSILVAINRADGKEAWSKAIGRMGNDDRGSGPRGTPTVDGERVYVLTESGDLACLTTDGKEVWQRNILREFGGRQLQWLISESPLVDGPHLIVSPGGPGAGMVKLDKLTGKTVWQTKELSDPAGYSSPIVADVQGVRSYMTFTAGAAVGVRASDGKLMWSYDRASNRTANITTPLFFDNKVFFTSNYGTGAALLALSAQNGSVSAKEIYFTREMKNHHGGVVLVDGYLYGFDDSILTCLDFATGKRMWRDRSVGKGSVTYADGHLYIQSEDNAVALAAASPSGYQEKGRFQIADKGLPSWAHPVISDGRLYVRNQDSLVAYDVKAR